MNLDLVIEVDFSFQEIKSDLNCCQYTLKMSDELALIFLRIIHNLKAATKCI